MQLSLDWIREFTPFSGTLAEFVHGMTLSGSKVEQYWTEGLDIKKVVTGKILSIEKHPDADRLVVTKINTGSEELQIVTGADNIAVGQIVPVALVGAKLAGNLKIKQSKLRGVPSEGMLCSIEELGYTRNEFPEAPEDGIYIFPDNTEIGISALDVLGINQEIVEFEITSNRPDCYSVEGLAREAAVTFQNPFKQANYKPEANERKKTSQVIEVRVEEPDLCPRYMACLITDVTIKQSPMWLKARLRAAGIRPINNIVDITNYVMITLGQPMHAFDLSQISGAEIVVRRAENNEEIITLDGNKHKLSTENLVIADRERAVALAGVMGAENSEVETDTETVLFECANFEPYQVRSTAKSLNLRSESSLRFEKGLPPSLVERAMNLACYLVEQTGSGKVSRKTVDVKQPLPPLHEIEFSFESINLLLGMDISFEIMMQILEELGIEVQNRGDDWWLAIIPDYRPDLVLEADLAEEIARIHGYDEIPHVLSAGTTPTLGKRNYKQRLVADLHHLCTAQGAYEIYTNPFASPEDYEKLDLSSEDPLLRQVKISNPLGEDSSLMRSSMLIEFLKVIQLNISRGNDKGLIYEIGKTYHPQDTMPHFEDREIDKDLFDEREHLFMALFDEDCKSTAELFFKLKGIIQEIFTHLGIKEAGFVRAKDTSWLHPGQSAEIFVEEYVEPIGSIGTIHPQIADTFDVVRPLVVADIYLEPLIHCSDRRAKFIPLPKYPSITRDLALIMEREQPVKEVEQWIKAEAGDLLESVRVFDVYQGSKIAVNQKSVAYSLIFRALDKTLNDEEVQPVIDRILNSLKKENIRLRDV